MLCRPPWHAAGRIASLKAPACMRGRCRDGTDQLCETSLQGSCVVPPGAGGQTWLETPLTEGPVQADGAQVVGHFLLGSPKGSRPIPRPSLQLPACWLAARKGTSAGEELTGLLPPSRLL